MTNLTKASLSKPRERLLQIMQRYNFCRIEDLAVRSGEPEFSPPPRVIQDIKIGGADNGPRHELQKSDFLLKASVTELFDHLSRVDDGKIAVIEVRYGLPFRLLIERPVAEELQ